jgi:hypothetical protein
LNAVKPGSAVPGFRFPLNPGYVSDLTPGASRSMVMAVSPPVRPATEGRVRFRVGIPDIGTVRAAGITARTVFPIGIAAIDKPDIRVAAGWRIGQLVEIVSGPGKYGSLVDQIHFRRAGLCGHDHSAAAVRPEAATPAGVGFRHQSN